MSGECFILDLCLHRMPVSTPAGTVTYEQKHRTQVEAVVTRDGRQLRRVVKMTEGEQAEVDALLARIAERIEKETDF